MQVGCPPSFPMFVINEMLLCTYHRLQQCGDNTLPENMLSHLFKIWAVTLMYQSAGHRFHYMNFSLLKFLLLSCILSKTGIMINSFAISIFIL